MVEGVEVEMSSGERGLVAASHCCDVVLVVLGPVVLSLVVVLVLLLIVLTENKSHCCVPGVLISPTKIG